MLRAFQILWSACIVMGLTIVSLLVLRITRRHMARINRRGSAPKRMIMHFTVAGVLLSLVALAMTPIFVSIDDMFASCASMGRICAVCDALHFLFIYAAREERRGTRRRARPRS